MKVMQVTRREPVEQHVITPLPEPPPPSADTEDMAFSCVYEGALGASSSSSRSGGSVLCLRVLRDWTVEGEWLRPLSRSSGRTPAKRARLSLAKQQEELEVFARVQGRVAAADSGEPSVDGSFCCYFDVLPVDGVLSGGSPAACHVHEWRPRERALHGQWASQRDKPFWVSAAAPCELFEQEITRAFEMVQTACSSARPACRASARVKHEPPVVKQEPAVVSAWRSQDHQSADKSERLRLYPLTPGVYEFTGFSIIAPPPLEASASRRRRRPSTSESPPVKDECFVTLRLLPDGKLQGTSRELLRPQSCRVTGTWRTDRVKYLLEYRVRDAVGMFKYSGRIEGDRKVLGKWYNVDEGHEEGFGGGRGEFELELTQAVRVKKEPSSDMSSTVDEGDDDLGDATRNKIRVLTTGAYTLKGCATDADGYEYACELVVELLPGGFLQGTSRELVFDQTRAVRGEWAPTFFRYRQEYVVKGDVGRYEYEGKLEHGDGGIISGEWGNMDLQDREAHGEHGTFAYGIVSARRRWSPFSHADYPASFHRAVTTVLLCSARTHALPVSLWYRTFAFCHESWFVRSTTHWSV